MKLSLGANGRIRQLWFVIAGLLVQVAAADRVVRSRISSERPGLTAAEPAQARVIAVAAGQTVWRGREYIGEMRTGRSLPSASGVSRVTDDCCRWHGVAVLAALLDAAGDVADGADGDTVGRGA